MRTILVTGLDGSGKSTFFRKLAEARIYGTDIIHVPHINLSSLEKGSALHNAASFINELGIESDEKKQPALKALSIFGAMLLFPRLAYADREEKQIIFCERHPLIDTIVYAGFYAKYADPSGMSKEIFSSIDERYHEALEYLVALLPGEQKANGSLSSFLLSVIYHEFYEKKHTEHSTLKDFFGISLPDAIYFLDADASVLMNRLETRGRREPHEKKEVLTKLRVAYSEMLHALSKTGLCDVHFVNAEDFASLDRFATELIHSIGVQKRMDDYPIVPGRGLVTPTATKLRYGHLDEAGYNYSEIAKHGIKLDDVRNKIESFIGSVEIPLGLVGPLLYNDGKENEMVYCAAATLEGALVASMNRGAKAVSMSGGFSAKFIHQKMTRCPMFIFADLTEAAFFNTWLLEHFDQVKNEVKKYSNHAELLQIDTLQTGSCIHANFVYSTGDASGQNMTTTCTWHGMLWIIDRLKAETGIVPEHYVIEGNGASDKKVSASSVMGERGVHVIAECVIEEHVINKILRTTSDAILKCYTPSQAATRIRGMVGYNINVANAIAAIFTATGQDIASVHESAVGILTVEKTERGLYLALNLPSLVIGTVGGGTSLPKQNEMLAMMGCNGSGRLERFAKLIAGFALSLELSTYAAIVSGEFAKAHEKLGRNKPMQWLLRKDLTAEFLKKCIGEKVVIDEMSGISFETDQTENGIITSITGRASKKLIGFIPFTISNAGGEKKILIKSKATDEDVYKGLHMMAASIDPALSDLIYRYRDVLEYRNCHLKEIMLFGELDRAGFEFMPAYHGKYVDESRETFLLFEEFLDENEMLLFNSENKPGEWSNEHVLKMISAISSAHSFSSDIKTEDLKHITAFDPNRASALYEKLISIIVAEEEDPLLRTHFEKLHLFLRELKQRDCFEQLPLTIIHNDFNPRNAGIRKNGKPFIYDWELAVLNLPHRDVIEFISFILEEDFNKNELMLYLDHHYRISGTTISKEVWMEGYLYALKEFLVCRMSFYKAAEILMKLKFTNRVMRNCFRMLEMIKEEVQKNVTVRTN
ncbi:MAG TPA: phosphotransferase [Bacteroidia bacterium]|jgi:hydroxymethylglutaryl-CoA reductase (NADPH)|nr:phosphotransferase [Bacteroidia bacterium]